MPGTRFAAISLACGATLFPAAACAPDHGVLIDLVESIESSDAFVETALIDLGTPVGRPYLLDGWLDLDERWLGRNDETFVWTEAAIASFRFFSFEPRELTLLVTLRPNPALAEAGPLAAEVRVNDGAPTRLQVSAGWEQYRIDVPPQFLRIGENRVALQLAADADPATTMRRLAVDRVQIERPLITYPARRELEGGQTALLLPYLSEIQYTIRTSHGAVLELGPVSTFGPHGEDDPGRVEVVIRVGSAAEPVLTRELGAGAGRASIPLPASDELRISLLSIPSWSPAARIDTVQSEEAVGMLVRQPVVRGPAS